MLGGEYHISWRHSFSQAASVPLCFMLSFGDLVSHLSAVFNHSLASHPTLSNQLPSLYTLPVVSHSPLD